VENYIMAIMPKFQCATANDYSLGPYM